MSRPRGQPNTEGLAIRASLAAERRWLAKFASAATAARLERSAVRVLTDPAPIRCYVRRGQDGEMRVWRHGDPGQPKLVDIAADGRMTAARANGGTNAAVPERTRAAAAPA